MNNIELSTADFNFTVTPNKGTWSVESRHFRGLNLKDVRMGIIYKRGRVTQQDSTYFRAFSPDNLENMDTSQGVVRQLKLNCEPDSPNIDCQVIFRIPENAPLLLWKVILKNHSNEPLRIKKIEMLRVGFVTLQQKNLGFNRTPTGTIQLSEKPGEPAFFSNGWQSWSYTGVYNYLDIQKRTRLGPIRKPVQSNAGTPQSTRRGHFTSDFFGILGDRTYRTGVLIGFLSQKLQFGSIEAFPDPFGLALRMWANGDLVRLDPGNLMETDWACLNFIHLDTPDPLSHYINSVAIEHELHQRQTITKPENIPVGWCTWYQYFEKISPEIITDNIQAASNLRPDLPLNLIQIDDGFQLRTGDWFEYQTNFPTGPAPLAAKIQQYGYKPGLWLAPFIVHPKANIIKKHPDWLLRNSKGKPVNAGFFFNSFTNALDLTNPDALDYTHQVIDTAVHSWGFKYLKLDFLFAASLSGIYQDDTLTRAQVLRKGLETLRKAAGLQTTLLGCSCPLGPALGLFDAMRISTDVAPDWHPRQLNTTFFFKPEPDLPSARNAIHNTLTRAPLHQRWWINDPDCLLVRPDSNLTLTEVRSLATAIALSGGSLLVSDDLSTLPIERLNIVKSLLPLIGKRPYVLDWFDKASPSKIQLDLTGPTGSWHIIALINWDDEPADLYLHLDEFFLDVNKTYLGNIFWEEKIIVINGNGHEWKLVPPHGCVLVALRAVAVQPIYVGSNLHISQGLEVIHWEWHQTHGQIRLHRPGRADGFINLYLPDAPTKMELDAKAIVWQSIGQSLYRVPLQFDRDANLEIELSNAS